MSIFNAKLKPENRVHHVTPKTWTPVERQIGGANRHQNRPVELETECRICGVEDGDRVKRMKGNHLIWISWAPGDEHRIGYSRATVVLIEPDGLCMPCHLMAKKRVCLSCRATEGHLITRKRVDCDLWSLDTDLADEFPEIWHPAKAVVFKHGSSKRCEDCAQTIGLPHQRPKCNHRDKNGNHCARPAAPGYGVCFAHQGVK